MKNKIVGFFAGFAAIFCICSCTQSLDPSIPADKPSSSDSGEEFELFAEVTEGFSADVVQSGATTRTILNDDWTVSWSESDLMSVFNRGAVRILGLTTAVLRSRIRLEVVLSKMLQNRLKSS